MNPLGDLAEWDVGLKRANEGSYTLQCTIPAGIGRALTEKGYNRARLTITDAGILIEPYAGSPEQKRGRSRTVELPDWNGAA